MFWVCALVKRVHFRLAGVLIAYVVKLYKCLSTLLVHVRSMHSAPIIPIYHTVCINMCINCLWYILYIVKVNSLYNKTHAIMISGANYLEHSAARSSGRIVSVGSQNFKNHCTNNLHLSPSRADPLSTKPDFPLAGNSVTLA